MFSPSAEQWTAFYEELADIEAWSWNQHYDPSDGQDKMIFISDGFIWNFSISNFANQVSTGGDNAIPNAQDPKKTSSEFQEVYENKFGRLGKLMIALYRACPRGAEADGKRAGGRKRRGMTSEKRSHAPNRAFMIFVAR